ncbi:hypothetical protein BVC80_8803g32 [Macleaya cordata]|uniref:Transmembrane protein n=1 Tax=Macleaya cordata TaxID=56857 RepID=A0A200QEJ0_MACCD|nr:hypothetical protein BVC80_8803g32 [Macleaya cordata]
METPTTLDFCGVLSESRKIMKAHSRHFLALSVLFLLPISFSMVAFRTLLLSITKSEPQQPESLLRYTHNQQQQKPITLQFLFLSLLYAFTILILSLCATGTITYSVYHGFFGRPVKFVSAIKSLSNSLLRLFTTVLSAQIIVISVYVFVGLVVFVVIKGIEVLGFEISYSSLYINIAYVIGSVVLGLGFLYLQVNWSLAFVIVTVEASWGFDPLMRSTYLVKGMRGVSLALMLFFGGIMCLILGLIWNLEVGSGIWRGVLFVIQTVVASACLMVLLLHSLATNTVLYMYCKALHGELAVEIAEEFARDYVSLPFDEEKVPHVVSVIQP